MQHFQPASLARIAVVMRRAAAAVFVFAIAAAPAARAWDYEGHRAINLVALSSLPADAPGFLRTDAARERIGFLAGEPDRWRSGADPSLRHINQIEHFFDIEDLEPSGMKFADLPQFRYVFVGEWALAREAAPHTFPKIDPARNKDATAGHPGFLPWAIAENYGKLKACFAYLRAFEEHGGTPEEIANAQANILYVMGTLGHYVGDACQPLHVTKHYNGWVGENPRGYSTARTIHSWIDGGFLRRSGRIDIAALARRAIPAASLTSAPARADAAGRDPIFVHTLAYIEAQLPRVAELYALDKAGALDASAPAAKEGRAFIENQFLAGAKMLADLWYTAWKDAPDDRYLINKLKQRITEGLKD